MVLESKASRLRPILAVVFPCFNRSNDECILSKFAAHSTLEGFDFEDSFSLNNYNLSNTLPYPVLEDAI